MTAVLPRPEPAAGNAALREDRDPHGPRRPRRLGEGAGGERVGPGTVRCARTVRPPLFELLLLRNALPTQTPTLELLGGATLGARDRSVGQALVEGR